MFTTIMTPAFEEARNWSQSQCRTSTQDRSAHRASKHSRRFQGRIAKMLAVVGWQSTDPNWQFW
ncbi:hypothetical protein, partial [Streptomyces sp. CO7]